MNPFLTDPETAEILGAAQKEALARMRHVVESGTLGVLTGEVGSGKSTLLNLLSTEQQQSDRQVIWLSSSRMSVRELYGGVLKAMGESPAFSTTKVKQQWREMMESRAMSGGRDILLLIDEAHEMPETTLLEVRFLMTESQSTRPAFPVVLAGQGKLRRTLNTNLLEPIAQRIRMQFHLTGLSAAECQKYLDDRMQAAGLERPVFTEAACRTIHAVSQGIPRMVNQLAGSALMHVQRTNDNAVEERHVSSILADMERQRGTRAS
jgi:type II secretory pathway predicted ATPase ExeA